MHVRRNVNALRPGGARIRALKAGVRAMKDRSVFPRTTREAGPTRPPSTAPAVGRLTPRRKGAGICVSMPASSFSPGTACTFTSSNAYCGRHPETPTWHFHTGTTQIPPSGRCRCRSASRRDQPAVRVAAKRRHQRWRRTSGLGRVDHADVPGPQFPAEGRLTPELRGRKRRQWSAFQHAQASLSLVSTAAAPLCQLFTCARS